VCVCAHACVCVNYVGYRDSRYLKVVSVLFPIYILNCFDVEVNATTNLYHKPTMKTYIFTNIKS